MSVICNNEVTQKYGANNGEDILDISFATYKTVLPIQLC